MKLLFYLFLSSQLLFILPGCGEQKKKGIEVEDVGANAALKEAAQRKKAEAQRQKEEKAAAQQKKADSKQDEDSDSYEGVKFEMKNPDKEARPEVKDDRSNVVVESAEFASGDEDDEDGKAGRAGKGDKLTIDTPAGCSAAKFQKGLDKIIWKPKWHFEGAGAVHLEAFFMSPDQSVLGVVERTGAQDGPFGSRIVLINTYSWEILKVHELSEEYVTKACWIPGKDLIGLWTDKQPSLKQPSRILIINANTGKTVSQSEAQKYSVSDIQAFKGRLLVKPLDEGECRLLSFKLQDRDPGAPLEPVEQPSENPSGVFAVLEDDGVAALAGAKTIELFGSDGGTKGRVEIQVGDKFLPDNAVFAGSPDIIAVSSYMGPALVFRNGANKALTDSSGRVLAAFENRLVYEEYKNGRIVVCGIPDLKEAGSFTPASLKPPTKGSAIFAAFLKHHGKLLVVDSHGNFCLYAKPVKSKKWKKLLIISSDK